MKTDNFVKIKIDAAQHNPGADYFTPSRTKQHDAAMHSRRRRWVKLSPAGHRLACQEQLSDRPLRRGTAVPAMGISSLTKPPKPIQRFHSALMLAALMIGHHFSISAL